MKKKTLTPEQKLEEYNRLKEKESALQNKLDRTESASAPRRAARLFRFPFGKRAFAAMWEASSFLGLTFIFAGVGALVGVGMLLCAILDAVWAVIFWLLYPVVLLSCILLHPLRVASLRRRQQRVEESLSQRNVTKIRQEIREKEEKEERERGERASASRYVPMGSGVTETDYYKNRTDEEYRRRMNLPPRPGDY